MKACLWQGEKIGFFSARQAERTKKDFPKDKRLSRENASASSARAY